MERPPGRDGAPRSAARPSASKKGPALSTFTLQDVAALGGPRWLARRRLDAFSAFEASPLPSEKEEVWRYSPIDELRLDDYAPRVTGREAAGLDQVAEALAAELQGSVVATLGGRPRHLAGPALPAGVRLFALDDPEAEALLGSVLTGGDALVGLNDAFSPSGAVLDVAPGSAPAHPVVLLHWSPAATGSGPAPADFPRSVLRVGAGATAPVVEVYAGAADGGALVVPVTECVVEDDGALAYVSCQVLGASAWHVGRLAARVGARARLSVFSAGFGAAYDRLRTEVAVVGERGSSELRSVYLGTSDQVHDVRTTQDHAAPRTTSDLLCKGAVAGTSRSVYSGLIRIRHGAVRSEAMQTNHNLVLDEAAHADSVPNLDIEENDVRCSHASTVGPVDEDQRFYLESRGVPPERAERLIVLGFFDDIVDRVPVPQAAPLLRREVVSRLAPALASEDDGRG